MGFADDQVGEQEHSRHQLPRNVSAVLGGLWVAVIATAATLSFFGLKSFNEAKAEPSGPGQDLRPTSLPLMTAMA